MREIKKLQLGMNPSTASNRLVKDLLWNFIVTTNQNKCYKCGESMCRDTFSIEHIEPWLHSENPPELFFNLDNVSYSHLSCNMASRRNTRYVKPCGTHQAYKRGCRCDDCKLAIKAYRKANYTTEERRRRYQRTGH